MVIRLIETVFPGSFKLGRPLGEGKFQFKNGYSQEGTFVEVKGGEEEDPEAGAKPPNVEWKGKSIVAF